MKLHKWSVAELTNIFPTARVLVSLNICGDADTKSFVPAHWLKPQRLELVVSNNVFQS